MKLPYQFVVIRFTYIFFFESTFSMRYSSYSKTPPGFIAMLSWPWVCLCVNKLSLKVFSIFSSALCYCTAELLVTRASVVRPSRPSSVKPVFSEPIRQSETQRYLFTVSPENFCVVVFQISNFYFFFTIFFSFLLTWDHMGEKKL